MSDEQTLRTVTDDDELEELIFSRLSRTYVQRADARQRGMGLQYMGAETHDLARFIARNITAWNTRAASIHADTGQAEGLVEELSKHWVTDTGCRHYEDGTSDNQFACWCGWVSGRVPTVGDGVRAWAEHVAEVFRPIDQAKAPSDTGDGQ